MNAPSTCTLSSILPFVRQALNGPDPINYSKFADRVWMQLEAAQKANVPRRNPLHNAGASGTYDWDGAHASLRVATNEAFFFLIRHGYMTPMPPQGTPLNGPNYLQFILTERGRDWANDKEPLPEEIAGYMKLLHERIPGIDTVIEQYIRESLIAFERQAYFAAAVMLGAASEKALYLLAGAMVGALNAQKRKDELERLLQRRSLNALFKFIQDTLDRNRRVGSIPFDGATPHFVSLFEAVRTQRNDAVHPTAGQVSADSVRLLTASFPYALRKSVDLFDWLSNNPHSLD